VKITSLTIGGSEWVSKVLVEGTEIRKLTSGDIGTATITVQDSHANIYGIALRSEIIIYSGANKIFAGYIAQREISKINDSISQAVLSCQDYTVILDRSLVTSEEEYTSTSDEAILDDIFSTYCSSVSTTPVVSIEASMDITIPAGTTVRQAVEAIADRTGAIWYVNALKQLEYYDPTSAEVVPWRARESSSAVVDDDAGDIDANWGKAYTSYAAATSKLTEDATAAQQHLLRLSPGGVSSANWYTFIAEAKAGERTWCWMRMLADPGGTPTNYIAWFDLSNAAVGTTSNLDGAASVVGLGDGWYRLYIFAHVTFDSFFHIDYAMTTGDNVWAYDGDGTSGLYVRRLELLDGAPFSRESFQYASDATNLANDIKVYGPETESESTTFSITASSKDGYVWASSDTTYPPPASGVTVVTDDRISLYTGYESSIYFLHEAILAFDTSDIPDDATILSATLRLYKTGSSGYTYDFETGVEWYDYGGTIDSADYTTTPGSSAWGFQQTSTAFQYSDQWYELSLSNPDTYVSKTGETSLRLAQRPIGGGTPSTYSYLYFASLDDETYPPELVITYQIPRIIGTASDATSQATYGVQKVSLYDSSLVTQDEADLRAEVELALRRDPVSRGSIETWQDGAEIGQLLKLDVPSMNLSEDVQIRELRLRQTVTDEGEKTRYSMTYGSFRPDYIRLLRKLKEATS